MITMSDDYDVQQFVAAIRAASPADLERLAAALAEVERVSGHPVIAPAVVALSRPPAGDLAARLFRPKQARARRER